METGRLELAEIPGVRHLDTALERRWREALTTWDAPAATRDSLERLYDPQTLVIVTGQQPGVWGGPLLSLYKAATAVRLARRWGKAAGRPAVAVFWVQGDDADWDEIGWLAIPGRDLEILRHRWHPAPVPPRGWVGEAHVSVPDELQTTIRNLGLDPARLEGAGADPLDLSTRFIRFLLCRLGEEGILPLDSRWPEIRAAGSSLWKKYLPRHAELGDAVEARGRMREERGELAPLRGEETQRGLFLLDGATRKAVEGDAWEAAVRAALEEGRGTDLAPSVLLRAILQDHLLAPAAQVVGRTEAAYLDQLAPIYEALEIVPPARVPRLSATLAPAGLLPGGEESRVVSAPEEWLGEAAGALVPKEVREALHLLRRSLEKGLESLLAAEGEGRGEMQQLVDSSRRRIEGQIVRLEEGVDRRARRQLYAQRPELRNLPEFLRPRRGPQERGLSGATLPLLLGEGGGALLLEAADRHLEALEEGSLRHFLLEGTDV